MNSRFGKIIALALIQCQFSMMLPAEELRTDLRRGMARLEHYLDRAAAERKVQTWEQLARAGMEAAMYEWESGALRLLEQDSGAWQEERRRAELGYRKETEAAYVRWISERIYNERADVGASELGVLLRETAAEWSYGNSGRILSSAGIEGARAAWERTAGELVDRYLVDWEEQQGLVYAELEDRFQDLGLSGEERQGLIRGVAEEHWAAVNREYGRIALAEGNRLMAELLYDQGSMKKLAADEAAAVIVRELAKEAEDAAEERTRELFAELDASFSAKEEDGIDLAAGDWLDQFRSAFEEGLARWEEAELGFLAARAEWEHDAEDAYLAGEETWNRAYRELTERQKAWEAAILAKLDEGFAKWQESQSRLSTEIETARSEFLAASEESRKIKEKMLDSQAEIYIRSRQMMDIVSRGIEGWYDLWNEKYLRVYTMTKQAAANIAQIWWKWIGLDSGDFPGEQFQDLDEDLYKNLLSRNFDIDALTDPTKNNIDLLRNQIELLKEACLALEERGWSLPVSVDEFMDSAGDLLNEENGWLFLAAKYREYADTAAGRLYGLAGSTGGGIEGYAGELQTELLKAEALLNYWDDELDLAETLNQYAQETGSVIEDAARTRKELEAAGSAYEKTVKNYETMVKTAEEKGLILDKAQERFMEIQAGLADLREAVEAAQQDYSNVLAAVKEMNPAPIYGEAVNIALDILKFWDGEIESGKEETETQSIAESILNYYRLSFKYAEILRSLEIGALLETLESGAGLGQPGIGELEAMAEEIRMLLQSGREEDLRAAAGLYPAELTVAIRWGDMPGEAPLYQNGRDLLIALDRAYWESSISEEQEIMITLMQEVWQEASRWYAEEALLRKQSIEYLKTGILPEVRGRDSEEADLRVRLKGYLAALHTASALAGPDLDSAAVPQDLSDLETLLEEIWSLPPEETAGALEEAGENPLFAALTAGTLVLPAASYAAAWLAQRQTKRDLGLFDTERAQLIVNRYSAYDAKNINRQNREARELVKVLIAAFQEGTGGAAGREGALGYAAELRNAGQGLNQTGREALDVYIAAFLEFAAVRDYHDNPENESYIDSLLNEFTAAETVFGVYTSWQYKVYDGAALAEIAGSREFALLQTNLRNEFTSYVSSGDYAALGGWAGKVIETAYKEFSKKADALAYAQYYQQEKDGDRFSWVDELAACGGKMSEYGIGNGILEEIDVLFTADAIDAALRGLKNKALWTGIWFTGQDEWNYSQFQGNTGGSAAGPARTALEKGWNEYRENITIDSGLYAMMEAELGRLRYINKSGQELDELIAEKKEVLNGALDTYNTYLDTDYDRAVKSLDQSCVDYNNAVDRVDRSYREMTAARLHLRKRQEIYDWASSVYLKDFGINNEEDYLTPLEKLSQVRYARERALIAVEVLKEILGGGSSHVDDPAQYSRAMELYKESRRRYYLAQTAAYEGETAIDRQQDRVREAELAEETAREKIVVGFDSFIPSDYELVNVTGDGNGGYRIELAYTLQDRYVSDIIGSHDPDKPGILGMVIGSTAVRKTDIEIDPDAFSGYFGDDKAVPVERVGAKEFITMAEYEAGEWIKRIGTLGIDYYDDVMLASLYIRYCAEDGSAEGNAWFKGIDDPRAGGNYTLGDIPLNYSISGFDLRAEYNSARRTVLQEAYTRVTAEDGGEDDIARYLLYRGRNIIGNAADYEENLLKARAMEIVDRAVGETHRNYTVAYKTALALGAALTATGVGLMASALFNPGLVILANTAFAGAAAAFVTAGILDHTCGQINDIGNGIKGLMAGAGLNIDGDSGYHTQFNNKYDDWKKALAYLSQERKALNIMMYGTEDKPAGIADEDPELSYENFSQGLSSLLNAGQVRTVVSYAEVIDLFTGELFDKSKAKTGTTVTGAIRIINSVLDKEAVGLKESLDAESKRIMAEQERNIELYHAAMDSAMVIPENRQVELRALALRAGDPGLDIAERRNAGIAYEKLIGELYGKAGDIRGEIQVLLKNGLGEGSWDSEWYAANLIDLEGELFGSRILYTRTAEFYTEQEIALLRASALASMDQNSALALSVKEWEWALQMRDFLDQYSAWQEQVEQIRWTGSSEWEKARSRMNEGYYNWQKKFDGEYREKTDAWDLNYLEFVNEKRQWVEDQYLYAVNVESAGLFDYTESDAARITGQVLAQLSIERMNQEIFDPSSYTDTLLADSVLGDLLSHINSLEGRGELGTPRVQTAVKRTSAAGDLVQASRILDEMNSDMRKAAAKLAAGDAQRIIEEAVRQFQNRLAAENKAVWEWEEHLVQANGYRTDGEIRRQAIVDSTAFENITVTQTVHRYLDYKPSSMPAAGVDLGAAAMQDLDADTVMRFVETARRNLDKWGEKIFGRLDDNERIMEHRIPRGYGELSAGGYAEIASVENIQVNNVTARLEKLESKGFESLNDDEKKEYESLANQLVTVRDGELGAHIGYGPILKDEVSYRHSPLDDALDRGAGEMGRIMLDFLWNSRVNTAGYQESFKALYDQKLWSGDHTPWMEAFTMRDIVSTAAGIGGMANPLIGFVDDVIFAGFDLGLGYQSPESVLMSLAANAAVSALSYGNSAIGGLDAVKNLGTELLKPLVDALGKETANMLFTALGSAAASYTTTAAMNAARSYDFSTGNFDFQSFAKSLYSTEILSSTLGSLAASGLSNLAGAMPYADQKLYGGLVNLAAAGYSEAARYSVYALDSMINGGGGFMNRLGQAYSNMGGITLNIADLGSILDLAGTISYRLGENYNTGLGALGGQFAGAGFMELNLGLGGASLSLGTGGINAGGSLYDSIKHGMDYTVLKYGGYGAGENRDRLIQNYLYGDWDAENTSMRIEAGRDLLRMDRDGALLPAGVYGYTTRRTDAAGRIITIADTGSINTDAVLLQHESRRDGYMTSGNGMETLAAVLAHTQMADRMLRDGLSLRANSMLVNDLAAYYGGGAAAFAKYALGNYDASGDYWKLTKEGNLEYDGFASLRDENGDVIISNETMGLSDSAIESALMYILRINPKDSEKAAAVRSMMVDSGIIHSSDADPSNWYWSGDQYIDVQNTTVITLINPKDLFSDLELKIWIEGSSGLMRIVTDVSKELKNLTALNMGKTINLESIEGLYNKIGSSGNVINDFIDTVYGSTVDFLNYADAGGQIDLAAVMISKYLKPDQLQMVKTNQQFLNNVREKPQDISTAMFTGSVVETQPFGVTSGFIALKRDSENDPYFLIEDHPAIDLAGDGKTITTPGGYWSYEGKNGYNAIFSLYGSGLRMRINHVNTDAITYKPDEIIGAVTGPVRLLDYPNKLYGTGSGTHVHVEYTLNLPYHGAYTRQYVSPNTLSPNLDYLDYFLHYYDQNNKETSATRYNRFF